LLLDNAARANFVRANFPRDSRAAARRTHHNGDRASAKTSLVKNFQRPAKRAAREFFTPAKPSQLRESVRESLSS
jgi:hypothetical protein